MACFALVMTCVVGVRRCMALALAVVAIVATLALPSLAERGATPAPTPQGPRCDAWEIEYALAANLKLSDTPMGQGDGVYKVGPGKVVLRFDNRDGAPGGNVKMRAYAMKEHFTIKSRTLFWSTVVDTDTNTRVTPDKCGVAGQGSLSGTTLSWSSMLSGYRTDGTLTCTGSLCGKFGAPPAGRSELHIGPGPVAFGSFVFDPGLKRFRMGYTFVAKTKMPKQTAHIALAGTERKRTCVEVQPCP